MKCNRYNLSHFNWFILQTQEIQQETAKVFNLKLHLPVLGLYCSTAALLYQDRRIFFFQKWSKIISKWGTNASPKELHIKTCNADARVFDLKVFEWTWLWCKNIITPFAKHTDQGVCTDTHAQGHHVSSDAVQLASAALTDWFIPAAKLVFEDRSSHKNAAEHSWKPSPYRRNQMWWD